MYVTVKSADLAKALREIAGVTVGDSFPLPILRNVLLEARGDRLRLLCTDLGQRNPALWQRVHPPTRRVRVLAEVDGVTDYEFRDEPRRTVQQDVCAREIPATVHEEGTTTVPARLFKDFAREAAKIDRKADVELELQVQKPLPLDHKPGSFSPGPWQPPDEHTLELRFPRYRWVSHIRGEGPDEFPTCYRDIDLGDWGFVAPVLEPVAA
jgi:hypothetical protein